MEPDDAANGVDYDNFKSSPSLAADEKHDYQQNTLFEVSDCDVTEIDGFSYALFHYKHALILATVFRVIVHSLSDEDRNVFCEITIIVNVDNLA